jgi:hypothetical protein
MTELDEAMQNQMAYIVYHENRPFCTNDFLLFECDGKEYKPNYGTIRNKFSEFKKNGIIEFCYMDINAYYSLKGHPFSKKSMTLYHTGGNTLGISPNHPLYKMLQSVVFDKQGLHNMRLRFSIADIYNTVLVLHKFPINEVSKDIEIPYWNKDNALVQMRIHKTDTISVVIGCTLEPIPLDYNGIIRLLTILARSEGLLQGLTIDKSISISIPHYPNWIITMWHFNQDGLKEYTGEKFSITVEKAHHTIERIYSKCFGNGKNKTRIRPRYEIQEYPNKTVNEAINDKLRVPNIDVPDSSNIEMHQNVQ